MERQLAHKWVRDGSVAAKRLRKIADRSGTMCQVLRYGPGGGLNKEMLEGVILGLEQSLDSSGRKMIPAKKTAITLLLYTRHNEIGRLSDAKEVMMMVRMATDD